MKSRNKWNITILIIFFILLCLRENGVIGLNFYSSKNKFTLHYDWQDKTVTTSVDSSIFTTKFGTALYSDVPVTILYEGDTLYNESSIYAPFVILIDSLKYGPTIWTPIYKTPTFSAVGIVRYNKHLVKTKDAKINLMHSNLPGHLAIKGGISVFGLSSRYHARKLIIDIIINAFVKETKEYLATLD